jgi:hypothetical protein
VSSYLSREPTFSHDRQWWWNGGQWVPASQALALTSSDLSRSNAAIQTATGTQSLRVAFHYSDDGRFVWNGTSWIVAPPAPRYRMKQTNHTFHLLFTMFTLGLWAPMWLMVAIINALSTEQY